MEEMKWARRIGLLAIFAGVVCSLPAARALDLGPGWDHAVGSEAVRSLYHNALVIASGTATFFGTRWMFAWAGGRSR
jgi:hypothetical protein